MAGCRCAAINGAMSSVVYQGQPPCDPKTLGVRLDQRRAIAAVQDCRLLDGLLEVANATTLIADPGDQAHFLKQRSVRTRSRKQVADLRDFTLYGCFVDFLTKLLAVLVLQCPNIGAKQIRNSCCGDFAVANIEAKWLQVAVFESTLALVEHRECFRFVSLHSGNCPFEHSLGLSGSAELTLLRDGGGREREGYDRDHTDHEVTKHGIPPVVWDLTHFPHLTFPRELTCPDL